ncbi:MAG: lycopene cyclase family protein [Polaribacter sp.]
MNLPNKNFDYIIVGGGASGLMMAYRMSKDTYFDDKLILIIDQVKKSNNDRTWCFWEKNKGDWDDILNHSWKDIIFKGDSVAMQTTIEPYVYKMIKSADFYQKVWKTISTKENIYFSEENVVKIQQEKSLGIVFTADNEYHSKKIINSILFTNDYQLQQKYPVLQQHFVGYFVRTKEPVFTTNAATFMDFTIPQKGNTRFMYVLPYADNEALFEYTLFSKELLEYNTYTDAIKDYLKHNNITDYEIVEKEQGAIPMTSYKFWNFNSDNILHIGTAGGWSKASTGFTFKNIDKKTRNLINYLKNEKSLRSFQKTNRFCFYDLLLLDILSKRNDMGAAVFSRMFKKLSPQLILKFLDEETTFSEELKIFSNMQIGLFSKTLIKRLF